MQDRLLIYIINFLNREWHSIKEIAKNLITYFEIRINIDDEDGLIIFG